MQKNTRYVSASHYLSVLEIIGSDVQLANAKLLDTDAGAVVTGCKQIDSRPHNPNCGCLRYFTAEDDEVAGDGPAAKDGQATANGKAPANGKASANGKVTENGKAHGNGKAVENTNDPEKREPTKDSDATPNTTENSTSDADIHGKAEQVDVYYACILHHPRENHPQRFGNGLASSLEHLLGRSG
jgi:hypothetical protein